MNQQDFEAPAAAASGQDTPAPQGIEQLAAAHGWESEKDTRSALQFVAEELRRASLHTHFQASPGDGSTLWGCYDCGFTGRKFKTLVQAGGEFQAQCPSCGSNHVDEAATVVRELVATTEDLREQLTAAGAGAVATPA